MRLSITNRSRNTKNTISHITTRTSNIRRIMSNRLRQRRRQYQLLVRILRRLRKLLQLQHRLNSLSHNLPTNNPGHLRRSHNSTTSPNPLLLRRQRLCPRLLI